MEITPYHTDWQRRRVNFILNKYDKSFFAGKKILELGAYNGAIGIYFSLLGSNVTIVEGRRENYDLIPKNIDNVNVVLANVDLPIWEFEYYDIIIHFGLLYHLEYFFEPHLINCCNNCDMLFLESEVISGTKDHIMMGEIGNDQSLTQNGIKPNGKYIESILTDCGFNFIRHDSNKLNSKPHFYDWPDNMTGPEYIMGRRRFWIANKQKKYI